LSTHLLKQFRSTSFFNKGIINHINQIKNQKDGIGYHVKPEEKFLIERPPEKRQWQSRQQDKQAVGNGNTKGVKPKASKAIP
jgi:hypothetical protein